VIWAVICLLLYITDILAAFLCKIESNTITATFWKWASPECQQSLVLYVRYLGSEWLTVMHCRRIGSLYGQNRNQHSCCYVVIININGALTISGSVSKVIGQWFVCCYAKPMYCLPLLTKPKAHHSLPPTENERRWRINDFWLCMLHYPRVVEQKQPMIEVLAAIIGNIVSDDAATTSNESQWKVKDLLA